MRQLPHSAACPSSLSSYHPTSRLDPETPALCPCPFSVPSPARPLFTPLPTDCVFSSSLVTSALHSILGEEARGGGRGPRWGGGPWLRSRLPPSPLCQEWAELNVVAGGQPWQELACYPARDRGCVPALSHHALGPDRRADQGAGHSAHPLQPDSGGAAGRHPRPGRSGPARGGAAGGGRQRPRADPPHPSARQVKEMSLIRNTIMECQVCGEWGCGRDSRGHRRASCPWLWPLLPAI